MSCVLLVEKYISHKDGLKNIGAGKTHIQLQMCGQQFDGKHFWHNIERNGILFQKCSDLL